MKRISIAVVVMAVSVLALATACGSDSSAERTITVTDTGTVKVVPNVVDLSFGVSTNASTAKAALAANSAAMSRVLSALKSTGIAARDIQTQQVNVYPTTGPNGTVIGYSASNSVGVTLRQIGETGKVIQKATNAGANTISGPTFSREHPETIYRQALDIAFDKAKRKAEAMAGHTGLKLGEPISIQEGSASQPLFANVAEASSAKGVVPPIEPGQTEVSASVTVSFEMG